MSTIEKGEPILAWRMHRYEAICTRLSALYGDLANTRIGLAQQKAAIYLNLPPGMSHGEKQARASHESVDIDTEVQQLNAEIEQLREERDMIRLFLEIDVGS